MKRIALLAALALPVLHAATAAAEPMAEARSGEADSIYGFGFRVGGYGFRAPQADATHRWSDCRMNGVGVFGDRKLTRNAFVEAGADVYFADNTILSDPTQQPGMDRLSGLMSVAGGLRMAPGARLSGYAQVGVGVELTRVTMGGHSEDPMVASTPLMEENAVFPLGFVGIGGDVRLTGRMRVGASFRTYLMAHFDHASGTMNAEPEAANQGQFYLRYAL